MHRIINDGRLPYKVKCFSLGIMLYALGLLVTRVSDTFELFFLDYGFFAMSMGSSLTLLGIIYACKQINPTLNLLDKTIHHSEHDRYEEFLNSAKHEEWLDTLVQPTTSKLSPFHWYILHIASPIVLLLVLGCLHLIGPCWVKDIQLFSTKWYINFSYYLFWLAFVGYIIGISLNRLGYYAFLINDYCRIFICSPKKKLDFRNSKVIEGLRPIGKLALKFNFALSFAPTLVMIIILTRDWLQHQSSVLISPIHVAMLVTYSIFLVFIFFFPIKSIHDTMVTAKKEALEDVQLKIEESIEKIRDLGAALIVKKQIEITSTWPYDMGLFAKIVGTVLFPVLAGAILQFMFEIALFKIASVSTLFLSLSSMFFKSHPYIFVQNLDRFKGATER